MLLVKIPRTCVFQGVTRYRPGGCLRNHTVRFFAAYDSVDRWYRTRISCGQHMRELLIAVLKDEMLRCDDNTPEYRRLEALHESLAYRRSVDLAYNPTFWRIASLSVGPDKTARMARVMQVLH